MADDSFKKTLMAALGWSFTVKLGAQLLTWAMTLLVIRILEPADYGLMALSQVFVSFMVGFANLGLGNALIQQQNMEKSLKASIFGLLIVVSFALTALLSLAAYPIAGWYHDERLVPLIQVSSLGFIFNALSVLPRAALTREMRVKPIVISEITSGFVSSLVVISLALNGFGVWALMLGWLTGRVLQQLTLCVTASWSFVMPRFGFRQLRPLIGYSLYTTAEYFAFVVMTSVDVLVVGRMLGPVQLGLYTVMLNFASMPLSKIVPTINSVAFPAFAMIQHREADARFYVLKATRLMALATVPIFLGMVATAPEIVEVVFGPAWLAAIPLLPFLSAAMVFRSLLIPLPSYLMGMGDSKGAFLCTATGAVLLPTAVLVGCAWGIEGVCYAWVVSYPLIFVLNATLVSRRSALPLREMLTTPMRPAVAGVAMVAAVGAIRHYLPSSLTALERLAVLVPSGAAVFIAVLIAAFPSLLGEAVRLVRRGNNSSIATVEPGA